MMRASRPATAPIMPETAVSKNTGATASWMPWVMTEGSVGMAISGSSVYAGRPIIGAQCGLAARQTSH